MSVAQDGQNLAVVEPLRQVHLFHGLCYCQKMGLKKISELDISQEGGELKIQNIFMTDLDGKYSPELYLSGPSTFEYDGVWND